MATLQATINRMEKFFIAVVIFNGIILGLETNADLMAEMGSTLALLDNLCLAVFTIEIILKLLCQKQKYFCDAWNVFDFIIVGLSYIPFGSGLQVLRSLRVLRLLLLISFMPRLRFIVRSLINSLPGIASISLLMVLIFYIAGVMATKLFGAAFPDWFGTLGKSLFTLFQIMTLESWAMGIVRPVAATFPMAFLFFLPFVILSAFIIMNIFISVIINSMIEARDKVNHEREQEERRLRAEEMAAEATAENVHAQLQALAAKLNELAAVVEQRDKK